MDASNVAIMARRLTDGWIQRCAQLNLGRPRQPDSAEILFVSLFVADATRRAPIAPRSSHGLYATIQSLDDRVDIYEQADLLDMALDCIPLQDLQTKAESLLTTQEVPGIEDGLADALVKWFRTWFKWIDPIKCPMCDGKTNFTGMGTPDPDERLGGAGRVELHRCAREDRADCTGLFRFPRYNDPKALMQFRRGRCGEFANLFCLFIRAVGLRARYVWNYEDHVWNEYFSPATGRWIHLDSCEAVRDEPLLYDRGWGKKMSYVLAFSVDGARDVSRGYVQDWKEALTRRQQGSEAELKKLLDDVTRRRRTGLPPVDTERLAREDRAEGGRLEEASRHPDAGPIPVDGQGRESGTEEWKKQRGEDGARAGPGASDDAGSRPATDT